MDLFMQDLQWIPSPYAEEPKSIPGVYLSPNENVEWFCIRDPKSGLPRVIGYAIRKKKLSTVKKSHLILIK